MENLSDDHITMQCHCHETAATLSRSLSLSHAARAPSVNPGLKLTQNIVSVKLSQQLSTASPPRTGPGPGLAGRDHVTLGMITLTAGWIFKWPTGRLYRLSRRAGGRGEWRSGPSTPALNMDQAPGNAK